MLSTRSSPLPGVYHTSLMFRAFASALVGILPHTMALGEFDQAPLPPGLRMRGSPFSPLRGGGGLADRFLVMRYGVIFTPSPRWNLIPSWTSTWLVGAPLLVRPVVAILQTTPIFFPVRASITSCWGLTPSLTACVQFMPTSMLMKTLTSTLAVLTMAPWTLGTG